MRKMGHFEFLFPTETWHFFLCDLIALVDKWPLKIYQEERKGEREKRWNGIRLLWHLFPSLATKKISKKWLKITFKNCSNSCNTLDASKPKMITSFSVSITYCFKSTVEFCTIQHLRENGTKFSKEASFSIKEIYIYTVWDLKLPKSRHELLKSE